MQQGWIWECCAPAGALCHCLTQPLPSCLPPPRLPACSIRAAGGFLIQVLPFAEDETLAQLEANIVAAGSVTDMLNKGMGPAEITAALLHNLGGNDTGFQLQPRWVGWADGWAWVGLAAGVGLRGHLTNDGGAACLILACLQGPTALPPAACPTATLTPLPPPWLCRLPRRYGPCEPADLQDRMRSAVALLGEQEVRTIIEEQGKIEVGVRVGYGQSASGWGWDGRVVGRGCGAA